MKKFLLLSMICLPFLLVLAIGGYAARAQDIPASGIYRGVSTAVQFDVSPPLRDITPRELKPQAAVDLPERATGLEGALGPQDSDPLVQRNNGPNLIPGPIVTFDGPSNIASVSPPDPVGDVGPNHYVAMSNLYFAIYDKAGTLLYGPAANNTLWAGFGGDCETDNAGDPIVLHDQISDRWMLSQFTASGPTYFNCVAVSQTADPTGPYYRWAFSTGSNFPDYPKYGFWSDALYISTREFAGSSFAGVGAYAVNRSQLIAGNPAPTVISFLTTPGSAGGAYNIGDGLLPTDLDGSTLPPAGTPNFFVGSMDNGGPYGAPQDALTIWEFTADFTTPANSTFVLANTLPIAAYDTVFPCSPGSRDCIPQPGTAAKIDILSYRQRPMWRLAYRNFGTHESLVTNQSVEASTGMAGIRWWEIRDPDGTPVLYQEGTYAPGTSDGIHRWMGSIAMDQDGNMALGYSASNATSTFPSVWYTGRLVGDPLGTMPQGEASIVNGTGSQTGSARWGDYTSMNIDPVDDCTFWYVNEYVPTTSAVGWRLRIGAFKFDECGAPDFTISATPDSQAICAGTDADYTITIGSLQGYDDPVTLSANGNPAPSTANFTVNPVTPPGTSDLTIGNTAGVSTGSYSINVIGTAPTSTHTTTVQLDVYAAVPGAPTLLTPTDGATGISVTPDFTWNAVSNAVSYYLEVADDAAFTNIIYTTTVGSTSHTLPGANALAYNTVYYWRVTAENSCGSGTASTPFSFTTEGEPSVYCSTPNLPIPDDPDVSDTLTIPTSGNILDVDVYINANHTWVGDLIFTLSHNATNAVIIDRPGRTTSGFGCSGNDYDVTVNDEGPDGDIESQCANAPAIFGNRVGGDPANTSLLSVYDGMDINGSWTLTISDAAGGDTGVLNEWCIVPVLESANASIELDKTVGTDPSVCATTDAIILGPEGGEVTYCYTVTNSGDITLTQHTLVDDQLGTILNNIPYALAPGASAFITETTTITQTTVNVADWTADDGGSNTASATDTATVTVQTYLPDIETDPDVTSQQPTNTVYTRTFQISNVGQVTPTLLLGGDPSDLVWSIAETQAAVPSGSTLAPAQPNQTDRAGDTGVSGIAGSAPRQLLPAGGSRFVLGNLSEGFDDITTLPGAGWALINNSEPLGSTSWFQGNDTVFPAQSGAPTSYIGANFNNTSGTGTISNWLLTPEINLSDGSTLTFYTRTPAGSIWPDRLEVRMSTAGSSTNVGTTSTSVGDFTNLLLEINPNLVTGGYPESWTLFTVTLSGVGTPTTGRLAFRYFVTDGGPSGANSNYIGIDTVDYVYTEPPQGPCDTPTDVPWLNVSPTAGTTPVMTTSDVAVEFDSTGLPTGVYTATLCISSNDLDEPLLQVPVTLTVVVPTYGVVLSPDDAASANAGEMVTYTVSVTNTSNVDDVIDLTAVSANGWTVHLHETSVSLVAGGSADVMVTVHVPVDATNGETDDVTVTAMSQGDPTMMDEAVLTTTAVVPPPAMTYIYLPIILKP